METDERGADEREVTDVAPADAAELTVACHVRAPMLMEPVDSHVETLRACETEGMIDALLLRSWSDQVRLDAASPNHEVVDRFEEFEAWANAAGVSIRPPFEVRRHTSKVTGERHERLVTPLVCLALYDGAELVGVYPHSADGETHTVADAIATLRTGAVPRPLSTATSAPLGHADCPACGGRLLNGQGVYACNDCAWAGIATATGGFESLPEEFVLPVPTPEP